MALDSSYDCQSGCQNCTHMRYSGPIVVGNEVVSSPGFHCNSSDDEVKPWGKCDNWEYKFPEWEMGRDYDW